MYPRQIVRRTKKNCPTDNLKLSEKNRQRVNSLQPVVSKSGCETTNKVLSVKCYERQIVRRTMKNCPTDNLELSEKNRQRVNSLQPVVSKSGCETTKKVLSVKCYERQIVRRTIKDCPTDNLNSPSDKRIRVCPSNATKENRPTDNKKLSDGQFKIVRKKSSAGQLIAACGK